MAVHCMMCLLVMEECMGSNLLGWPMLPVDPDISFHNDLSFLLYASHTMQL